MEPIFLEGSLADRHKLYNATLKKACSTKDTFKEFEDYKPQRDIEKLLKVDLANRFRDVNYILEIFKSNDNLLKNRALKCLWFFDGTLPEISKAGFMKDVLFPYVSRSSLGKIVHNLSLHLKNETYAEEYYIYFLTNNKFKYAIKFLALCSVSFIKKELSDSYFKLTKTQLMKISERDINLSYIYFKDNEDRQALINEFTKVISLMASVDTERFLNWYETTLYPKDIDIRLGERTSLKILSSHKTRIVNNIQMYAKILKRQAMLDVLNVQEIEGVLRQLLPKDENELWNSSKSFLDYTKKCSKVERFDIFQNIYKSLYGRKVPLDKCLQTEDWKDILSLEAGQDFALININEKTHWISSHYECSANFYGWYSFVDFRVAFPQLRTLLKSVCDPVERIDMLNVMTSSYCRTKRNDDLLELLQYYCKYHIKEQRRYTFVHKLMDETIVYKYPDDAWAIISKIWHKSKWSSYTHCEMKMIISKEIIMHHLWKEMEVPQEALKSYLKVPYYNKNYDFDIEVEVKFFQIISNELQIKFDDAIDNNTASESNKKREYASKMMNFLRLWNEHHAKHKITLESYPTLVQYYIRNIEHLERYSFNYFFFSDRKLFKFILNDLLKLDRREITVLYCLKHKDSMLNNVDSEILKKLTASWKLLKKFYRKLNLYFTDDLKVFWIEYFLRMFKKTDCNDKVLRQSLFALSSLLSMDTYINVIEPYTPLKAKVDWSEIDPNIRKRSKLIATFCHYVRPVLPSAVILPFTKGDYLQDIVGSLVSICHQYPQHITENLAMSLLDSPVSLQKHAIRLLISLFDSPETTHTLKGLWSNSTNTSIRFVILENLVRFLTEKTQNEVRIRHLEFLKLVLGQLKGKADTSLYDCVIEKSCLIHPENYSDYCEYTLKALMVYNDENYLGKFLKEVLKRQKYLSGGFCHCAIIAYLEKNMATKAVCEEGNLSELDKDLIQFIVKYLLYVDEESEQSKRISQVYEILENYSYKENVLQAKKYFAKVVVMASFEIYNNMEFVSSTKLIKCILNDLSIFLKISEEFQLVIIVKLTHLHHELFERFRSLKLERNQKLEKDIRDDVSIAWQTFGERTGKYLNTLTENYFKNTSIFFQNVFNIFVEKYLHFRCFESKLSETYVKLNISKGFISNKCQLSSVLIGVQLLPRKIEDNLSHTLYKQIINDLENDTRLEVMFFLNAHFMEYCDEKMAAEIKSLTTNQDD